MEKPQYFQKAITRVIKINGVKIRALLYVNIESPKRMLENNKLNGLARNLTWPTPWRKATAPQITKQEAKFASTAILETKIFHGEIATKKLAINEIDLTDLFLGNKRCDKRKVAKIDRVPAITETDRIEKAFSPKSETIGTKEYI